MPAAHRLGDVCTGHGGFPSRPNVQGSPNVFVNGIPVHRLTDLWAIHCDPNSCHNGSAATSSMTVRANGLGVCRIGDTITGCASLMLTGSPDVLVGN